MNEKWSTKEKDMLAAQQIMQDYVNSNNIESLFLFELTINREEKKMNFRVSNWVITLAYHFKTVYGASQGDFVTRKVISHCLINGQTIH